MRAFMAVLPCFGLFLRRCLLFQLSNIARQAKLAPSCLAGVRKEGAPLREQRDCTQLLC